MGASVGTVGTSVDEGAPVGASVLSQQLRNKPVVVGQQRIPSGCGSEGEPVGGRVGTPVGRRVLGSPVGRAVGGGAAPVGVTVGAAVGAREGA